MKTVLALQATIIISLLQLKC